MIPFVVAIVALVIAMALALHHVCGDHSVPKPVVLGPAEPATAISDAPVEDGAAAEPGPQSWTAWDDYQLDQLLKDSS